MEITINLIILILLSVILFVCGFMIRGRIRRTLKLNSIQRYKSGQMLKEPEFIITKVEYAGFDDQGKQFVKNSATLSYFDENGKQHAMNFVFYSYGTPNAYTIGEILRLAGENKRVYFGEHNNEQNNGRTS